MSGCVNCGNDEGTQKICLDCLELIDCGCKREIPVEENS